MAFVVFLYQVITFIDLAGHERYLKTTIFGMTGHVPDFAMLMVSICFKLSTCVLVLSTTVLCRGNLSRPLGCGSQINILSLFSKI